MVTVQQAPALGHRQELDRQHREKIGVGEGGNQGECRLGAQRELRRRQSVLGEEFTKLLLRLEGDRARSPLGADKLAQRPCTGERMSFPANNHARAIEELLLCELRRQSPSGGPT
jgi:hypothetical protein